MEAFKWHLQDSYKNLYESEISILKRGLNGLFNLVKMYDPNQTNEIVNILGEIAFGENQKQGVLIVFPTKYPYAPPRVIAVDINMSMLDNLSQACRPVQFGKGNQYGDGAMCLFRNEVWEKDQHNIGWILRRTKKWLESAHSKEGFKKEDIVEELPAPFVPVGQVLLPKDVEVDSNAKSGMMLLTQFKPNYFILAENTIQEYPFKHNLGAEQFTWYRFDDGIRLRDLFKSNDPNYLINYMLKNLGVNIIADNPQKNIAFYLPGDEKPWHFFKFVVQSNGLQVVQIKIHYFLSRNIENELYLRTKDIFDDKILAGKRVTIIGLGAFGSEVAKSLAKNGVGHFNLFDMDTFEIGNSIRHAADLAYIGEDKVAVVKQLIQRSNPNITVNPYKIDVLKDTGLLESCLLESDLCIVLTAEESVDYLINDHYVRNYDFPFIFARASSGAFSGAIQVVDSDSACLRCLSLSGNDTLPKSKTKVDFLELKPEYGSCSSPALPGSEIDAKEISLQVARIALQCLLKGEGATYPVLNNKQFFWHGPYGSDQREPFAWEMKNIKKSSKCYLCK